MERDLDDAVEIYQQKVDTVRYKDKRALLDIPNGLPYLDAKKRITLRQALRHRGVTVALLADDMDTRPYVDAAVEFMTMCPGTRI